MINVKKERNKIIKDLEYGERIGAIKHSQGKEILAKFDKDCMKNKERFDRKGQKRIVI